jgi:hypothetical protein
MVGWIFPTTRTLHFWAVITILFAWLGIGWYVGTIGYCPITDYHWEIKRSLGETQLPNSFIKYMLDWVFQADFERKAVDQLTGIVMVLVVTITGWKKFEAHWLTPA